VSDLKRDLHRDGLSRGDRLLIILSSAGGRPLTVSEIRQIAVDNGVPGARTMNISDALSGLGGKVIRIPKMGWELSDTGKAAAALLTDSPTPPAASPLRDILAKLTNSDVKDFVQEGIGCIESKHYRAAVVLTWVGALAVLYDVIVTKQLASFNTEATKRDAKWKMAKNADDLSRMKEYDFLQVLEAISVIGKNVKGELEACLKLRNACGHPNSLKIAENRVAAHVETLVLNIFAVFV
jgi:hypothetical protein